MSSTTLTYTDDACYKAMLARDARFDGSFFTGVTSTGIYCRPICKVRIPKRKNCQFYRLPVQAEAAGFRPCLRCRPELAPHSGSAAPHGDGRAWSSQDASHILARQAAQLLDSPEGWGDEAPGIERLAQRLGVTDRHVRRIFEAEFGVSPLRYLQTRRLLSAKQWLTDTDLSMTQIAGLSGFNSVRRFNTAFSEHYGLNPSQLRRHRADAPSRDSNGILIRAAYRPPYDVAAMVGFHCKRMLGGVEAMTVAGTTTQFGRTLRIEHAGKIYRGWMWGQFVEARHVVEMRVSDSLLGCLPVVTTRLRAMLDLDADPMAINAVLDPLFPDAGGLRVPGTMDGFELAVRAILGQQITIAAARTITQRLVDRFGEDLQTPIAQLTRLFPSAQVLAQASGDGLGQLGIVKQRQTAIGALANAVLEQRVQLISGADVQANIAALKELPGIGDWTAQYIAMRALRWPDAFPAGDVALQKAIGVQGNRTAAKDALARSEPFKPWRSYAVLRAWSTLGDSAKVKPDVAKR
ncbi:MAG: DNA-3-methyladenine glycosylase 2 family protein [Rhodocyclaceae bacterium]|nr:DNA-3-methyladenine glycosylase 2 family protein [Rhodocyclaceae bacterium]